MITPLSKDQIKDLTLQNPTFREHKFGTIMDNMIKEVNNISTVTDTDIQLLQADVIVNTTPTTTNNANGDPDTIVYKRGETIIRTDTYTYSGTDMTTETRTLPNGKYITIDVLTGAVSDVQEV